MPDYDVEQSETLIYHIHLLEEMGEFVDALSMLDVNAKSRAIVDRTAIMETRGKRSAMCTFTPSDCLQPACYQSLDQRRRSMRGVSWWNTTQTATTTTVVISPIKAFPWVRRCKLVFN